MNKKQIIKQYVLLLCPLLLVAVGVFSIVALTSRNLHNDNETEETSQNRTESADKINESDEMIQLLKDVRIEKENMRLWESVFTYNNYNEVVNREYIRGPESPQLYKGRATSSIENTVDYYFQLGRVYDGQFRHVVDCVTYSMEEQSLLFRRPFQSTSFLDDDVQEELDARGAEYLGYITIEYPAPYFPTPHITERKQAVIDVLKDNIKDFIISHIERAEDYGYDLGLEPGEYPVYILNFTGTDSAGEWMLYDKKNKQYASSFMVISDDLEDCHSSSPHLSMDDDTDCGGIMHSELFIKLSIYNFTVVIE